MNSSPSAPPVPPPPAAADAAPAAPAAPPVPFRLQVAAAVTRYQSCTVDPRPGRAVHCPDLNACLVNEGRPVAVDCNAVHFGYAIPVTVVPLPEEPDLAELVLDPSPDLTPRAVSYLLKHHPQLRGEPRVNGTDPSAPAVSYAGSAPAARQDMAATAKHEPLRGRKFAPPPPPPSEPEEDIAAFAKQISDHAEAIYQTWKSRGLAPTEILTCHSNATAADKFGSALTPTPQAPVGGSSPGAGPANKTLRPATPAKKPTAPSSLDLLAQAPSLDANNLEKLVSNFVSEDKARLAAQRQHQHQQQQQQQSKALPSSIQFALQKFEKQSPKGASPYAKQASPETPKAQQSPSKIPTAVSPAFGTPHHARSPSIQPTTPTAQPAKTPSSPGYRSPGIQLDTIEVVLPPDLDLGKTAKKTGDTPDSPNAGVTTWPLKNKGAASPTKIATPEPPEPSNKYATMPSNKGPVSPTTGANNKNSAYLEEVAREEERLINALKTGIIIAEEPSPVNSPTQKKSNILLKKKEKSTAVAAGVKKEKKVEEAKTPAAAVANAKLDKAAPELDKSSLSNLSAVDFAKARYRSAQERPLTQQRLDDARQLRATTTPAAAPAGATDAVAAARSRFQAGAASWKQQGAGGAGPAAVVPHPELTTQQRQHLRAAAAAGAAAAAATPGAGAAAATPNPVRPFLTRGSVAERVLIFEKCPSELLLDKPRHLRAGAGAAPALATWRTGHDAPAKAQTYTHAKETSRPPAALPPNTTLQRHVKANRNVHIPRFYFPKGKPNPEQLLDQTLQKISSAFRTFPNQQVPRDQFHTITKACDCPLYWKVPLFIAAGGEKLGHVEANSFLEFWKTMCSTCHDPASRFFYILSKGQMRDLSTEDFIPLVQDVVDTHPGLTFLKEATEFHSRYVHTVITRIFYCVNRSWSGKISLPELRRSDLLRVIRLLEEEEDINQVTAYFSYEHFYVIYCKFWELDRDHDLFIDRQDLARHSDHALSTRMIDRIFSGAVTRGGRHGEEKMSYTDFVWFLLSEEDKRHPTAIEYWFRCMDLDGDGYLSMYELEYFYEEQLQRMEAIGIETLPFEDCLCQMLDMIQPAQPGKVSLSDLKRCKMTPIFFDTFFNLEKYLDHEQRDPFSSQRDHDGEGHELSDWDRYAADEYELLVAEEGGNDPQDEQFENNGDDVLSPNLDSLVSNGGSGPMLDLGEDGCMDDGPSSWKNSFDLEADEESDNSGDYAADSDECPV